MIGFLLGAVIVGSACFAFLNGFRDVSTAVALSVRTRALTPTIAVILAGAFNFIGALISVGLASAFSEKLFDVPLGAEGLLMLLAALTAACLWGLYQWRRGYPSSSTHALIGGLMGTSIAASMLGMHQLQGISTAALLLVVLPLLISPALAYLLGFLAVFPTIAAVKNLPPSTVNRRARQFQAVAGAAVAFGHGLQDGQRTTAVLLFALVAAGAVGQDVIPLWVPVFTAVFLTLGTLLGGWRISYTLGQRLVRIDPMRGFVAQSVAALLLFVGSFGLAIPLSTTHTVTAAVSGAGQNQRFAVTSVPLMGHILLAWIATPVACALLGGVFFLALSPLGH